MRPTTLLAMHAPVVFGGNLLAPLYALFAERIGASAMIISLLVALPIVIGGLLGYLVSRYITQENALNFLRASYLIRSIGFLFFFIPTIPTLFAVQICMGIAHGLGSPSFFVLFSGKDGVRWGERELIDATVISSSMFIGGLIVTFLSWNALFSIMVTLPLVSILLSYRLSLLDRASG